MKKPGEDKRTHDELMRDLLAQANASPAHYEALATKKVVELPPRYPAQATAPARAADKKMVRKLIRLVGHEPSGMKKTGPDSLAEDIHRLIPRWELRTFIRNRRNWERDQRQNAQKVVDHLAATPDVVPGIVNALTDLRDSIAQQAMPSAEQPPPSPASAAIGAMIDEAVNLPRAEYFFGVLVRDVFHKHFAMKASPGRADRKTPTPFVLFAQEVATIVGFMQPNGTPYEASTIRVALKKGNQKVRA